MSSPKGLPKGLDFAGCLNVTFVLRDFQVLTGKIRGVLGDDRFDWNDYVNKDCDPFKKDNKDFKDHKDHKETKCDVDVKVEEECKFILVELTRPSAALNLSTFTCTVLDSLPISVALTLSGTTFPAGACVAINCENIIYAGPGPEFCDIPIGIGATTADGVTVAFRKAE